MRSRRCGSHGVPAYGYAFGFKGSFVFDETPARNCREFLAMDTGLSHLHFLVQHNGGVFMAPWGKSEQWTISPMHTDADVDRFCDNVERLRHTGRVIATATLTSTPPAGSTEPAMTSNQLTPTLSGREYISDEVYQRERSQIFHASWFYVCREDRSRPAIGSSPMSPARACCW